jgi:hypothetical protein
LENTESKEETNMITNNDLRKFAKEIQWRYQDRISNGTPIALANIHRARDIDLIVDTINFQMGLRCQKVNLEWFKNECKINSL